MWREGFVCAPGGILLVGFFNLVTYPLILIRSRRAFTGALSIALCGRDGYFGRESDGFAWPYDLWNGATP